MRLLIWAGGAVAILLIVAGALYVRLAPSKVTQWHIDPAAARTGPGRFVVRPDGGDFAVPPQPTDPVDVLARIEAIALEEPRTEILAGEPDMGRITFITRSALFGFPDYTTVSARSGAEGTEILIFARLRFGRSDLGVNERRVRRWLKALETFQP